MNQVVKVKAFYVGVSRSNLCRLLTEAEQWRPRGPGHPMLRGQRQDWLVLYRYAVTCEAVSVICNLGFSVAACKNFLSISTPEKHSDCCLGP